MNTRLIQLNNTASRCLEFRSYDEDESHLLRNTAIGAGGLAAAGAGAAYYRGGQIPRPSAVMSGGSTFGNRLSDVGTRMRVGAAQLGDDAAGLGRRAGQYASGAGGAIGGMGAEYRSLRSAQGGLGHPVTRAGAGRMSSLWGAVKGAASKIKGLRFDAMGNVIEFRSYDDESHLGRNAAIGALLAGAGVGGVYARGARYNAANNWEGRMEGSKFGFGENMRSGVTGLRDDATRAGRYAKNVGSGIAEGAGHYGDLRAGAKEGLGLGRGASAKGALKRLVQNVRNIRYQSSSPLIALNAKLDSVIEFEDRPKAGYWSNNMAATRAMRASDKGVGLVLADPELIGNRVTKSLGHSLAGAGIGAGAGAGIGALVAKNMPRGRGAGIGAIIGGLTGAGIGDVHGMYSADKAYLAKKGITMRGGGFLAPKLSKEAQQKYLHQDYAGGGWKPSK